MHGLHKSVHAFSRVVLGTLLHAIRVTRATDSERSEIFPRPAVMYTMVYIRCAVYVCVVDFLVTVYGGFSRDGVCVHVCVCVCGRCAAQYSSHADLDFPQVRGDE